MNKSLDILPAGLFWNAMVDTAIKTPVLGVAADTTESMQHLGALVAGMPRLNARWRPAFQARLESGSGSRREMPIWSFSH